MREGRTRHDTRGLRLLAGVLSAASLVSLGGCRGLSLFGLFESENPGPFSISPSAVVLQTDQTVTLRVMGGFGTYTFDDAGLMGSFDPDTGTYDPATLFPIAPEPLSETITVSDGLGNERTATLTVYNEGVTPLAVTPSSWSGTVGDLKVFTISGGFPGSSGYTASLGGSSLPVATDQVTVDTAGLAAGEHRLEVTDEMQALAVAVITVVPAGTLGIDPLSATVAPGAAVLFTALNASSPVFSVESGPGTIAMTGASTAEYQSPNAGTAVVRLDDGGVRATATVYVVDAPALKISPAYAELRTGEALELRASGGVPPYSFALAAGKGAVEQTGPAKALYTAPATLPSRDQVTLSDSVGSLPVYAVIKVSKPR